MNRHQRLARCYDCQESDRPAVFVRTGFPADDPSYDRLKAYLQEHTELKAAWSASAVCPTVEPVEKRFEPVSQDWQRQVSILSTPAGRLRSSTLVSLKGQPGLHETYYVNSREDTETYLSLPMPEVAGPVDSFFEAVDRMGDRGIVDVSLGVNPGGMAATLCGSENFALLSISDRDALHALCERQMRIIVERLRYLLARRVGPYFSMSGEEYISPPLHGPKDFYDFNVRYNKPITDLVHEASGWMHTHCHGSIRRVFQGFLDMGTDVLHPFEAPPMGDITPAEAKSLARGRICLEGNLQIGDMYEKPPDEIRRQTEQLIAAAFDDRRGLIVCPTASPYIRGAGEVCFPMFRTMVETVLDRGRRA
jgi:hypothetical protein